MKLKKNRPTSATDEQSKTSISPALSSENKIFSMYSKILNRESTGSNQGTLTAEEEVRQYLEESLVKQEHNVLDYWRNNTRYPSLRKLAKRYLCIRPSTVSSERLFSAAGALVDKKRNRLDPERVKMLIFLNKNLKYRC